MRSRILVIIDFYAVRRQLSAFPSDTENLAKQMQDEIEAEAESIHQRRDEEARKQEHRSAANALYEGALGALPAGYGNNGLTPVDASVARAFSVLPSQPRSQNDVNNPVVAHQPPHGDETPPPGGEAGVVAAVQGGGDGVAGALASPGGGVGVAAVLAPPGGRPAQRARAATAALQRQIAAGAAPTSEPTVISTGEAAQIRRGRAPDLNGTVISLNGLMDRARGMIETSEEVLCRHCAWSSASSLSPLPPSMSARRTLPSS
jgi:hypothetical protein